MKKILVIIVALFFLAGCQFVDNLFEVNETTDDGTVLIDLDISSKPIVEENENMKEDTTTKDETTEPEEEVEEETMDTEEEIVEEVIETEEEVEEEEKETSTSDLAIKNVKEGDMVRFKKDIAYDPDGDSLDYEFSLPLDKEGEWQTEVGDAGEYIVMVSVSDGKLESSQKFKIVVEAVNAIPVISGLSDITINEGETIELDPKVSDSDEDEVKLTYSGFMTSDTYKTNFEDSGTHTVTLTADDGKQSATKTVTITVENVNRAPKLEKLDDVTVVEGETISISTKAVDEDGDEIAISFSKPLDKTGNWETEVGDAGTYEIDVVASDSEDEDTETFKVIVKALNNLPKLTVPNSIEVMEGEKIEINTEVSDSDGDSIKITYSGYMTSSSYTPGYDEAGTYTTTVTATDGKETVSEDITIVVKENNRPPVFVGDGFFE